MSVKKLSVAIDEHVAAAAEASADAAGLSLSAWMNRAAEDALAVERGLAEVRAWEAENGALSAAELADADRILDDVLGMKRRTRRAS
jgi:hypothetical protein